MCPVLCSGHGAYAGGICHCSEGWKGAECDVPAHDCEPADCSGRGQCIAGQCNCKAGWKGAKCDEGNLYIQNINITTPGFLHRKLQLAEHR